MSLNVVFDISELGSFNRTGDRGIRRVVKNLALALLRRPELQVRFAEIAKIDRERILKEIDCATTSQLILSSQPCALQSLAEKSSELVQLKFSDNTFPSRVARRLVRAYRQQIAPGAIRIPAQALRDAQILHSARYPLSPTTRVPAGTKLFLTIHDLIPIMYPHLVPHEWVLDNERMVKAIRPDSWLVCVSEAAKSDVCARLGFDPTRVFVAPLAASTETFYPEVGLEASGIRAQYGIGETPYILSLGAIEKRKNLRFLIEVFGKVKAERAFVDTRLVLVGRRTFQHSELDELIQAMDLSNSVIFTGFVPDAHLAAVYSGAVVFTFPSLAEGFGLPPLEAMQCGVPVVCSNRTSLPEVVGDAGFLVDPEDHAGWISAIKALLEDRALRESFSAKSLARSQHFSWDETAKRHVLAYKTALSRN